jgi:glycosyltransferase involved in cell wall biosynthesis
VRNHKLDVELAPHICMLIRESPRQHPVVRRQIPSLLRAGCTVTVVDYYHDTHSQQATIETLPYSAIHVRPVSLHRWAKLAWLVLRRVLPGSAEGYWTFFHFFELLLGAFPMAFAAHRVHAAYYHAHDLYSFLPALIAGRLRRVPVIYDAHEFTSEQGDPRSLRNAVERRLEQWLVPRADELIVPSARRGQLYVERYGLHKLPKLILNCPPLTTPQYSDVLRQRLQLPPSLHVVLYHGSLLAGRGLEQLVLSVHHFDASSVLVFIGSQGEFYRDVLAPLVDSEKLTDRVFFVPYVPPEEMMRHVVGADVGVAIYRNVNLNNYFCAPTKLYEYLMAGVPVVTSAFPELVDFLTEHRVGRTFDPDCPESIAAAVNNVCSTPPAVAEIRTRAIERVRHEFNWERESQKLLGIFGVHAV